MVCSAGQPVKPLLNVFIPAGPVVVSGRLGVGERIVKRLEMVAHAYVLTVQEIGGAAPHIDFGQRFSGGLQALSAGKEIVFRPCSDSRAWAKKLCLLMEARGSLCLQGEEELRGKIFGEQLPQ